MCSKYWHQTVTTGHCIRKGITAASTASLPAICQENATVLASELAIKTEDVMMTWVSELQSLETDCEERSKLSISCHTSDFTIWLDREQQAVVVTILGTRIFPAPNIYDIVMDIRAETQPFLHGEAHAGMVIGARNLMSRSWEAVREAVTSNSGYSILVVGYSLGAGLAQLYTAQLLESEDKMQELPSDTKIRALCYGAPPVYRPSQAHSPRLYPEIVIIQNNKDGIIA